METAPARSFVRSRRAAVWLCLWLVCLTLVGAQRAAAQLQIELTLPRRTFMLYEPLVATITLTNQAGRDVTLEDMGGKQWFNVEITTLDGQVIQPYDPNYKLNPLTIPAGQTLKRKIDLNPLFPVREIGTHRMRANVYLADSDRFFASSYVTFDIAEGQLMWRQDVGVPGSTDVREMSLLTFQRPDRLMLYARVRDGAGGTNMYSTQPLGRVLSSGVVPQVMLDRQNTLHILQEALPSAYLYTQVSVDGERLNQQAYNKVGTNRPSWKSWRTATSKSTADNSSLPKRQALRACANRNSRTVPPPCPGPGSLPGSRRRGVGEVIGDR